MLNFLGCFEWLDLICIGGIFGCCFLWFGVLWYLWFMIVVWFVGKVGFLCDFVRLW